MTRMMDAGYTVDFIYLDFAKSFDSGNQRFLLAKMKSFELGDVVVRRIEADVSGRFSGLHVDGEHSKAISMHSGVPQGSVIGPLLFLLFLNDPPNVLEALTLLFADDVEVVTQWSQSMNLHSSLIAAGDWSNKWGLHINPTKCNYLTIEREVPLRLPFFPDGSGAPIHVYKLVTDLGVQRDNMFWLSAQCTKAANKACRLIFLIRRSIQDLSKSAFVLLYGSLVRPRLEYGMSARSSNRVADINQLERIQR